MPSNWLAGGCVMPFTKAPIKECLYIIIHLIPFLKLSQFDVFSSEVFVTNLIFNQTFAHQSNKHGPNLTHSERLRCNKVSIIRCISCMMGRVLMTPPDNADAAEFHKTFISIFHVNERHHKCFYHNDKLGSNMGRCLNSNYVAYLSQVSGVISKLQ